MAGVMPRVAACQWGTSTSITTPTELVQDVDGKTTQVRDCQIHRSSDSPAAPALLALSAVAGVASTAIDCVSGDGLGCGIGIATLGIGGVGKGIGLGMRIACTTRIARRAADAAFDGLTTMSGTFDTVVGYGQQYQAWTQ